MLLQGGLREGQVTELVGPSPSGKTQVRSLFLVHLDRHKNTQIVKKEKTN